MAHVEYEVKGRIGYITLNRPEKLNAITRAMMADLMAGLEDIRANQEVWLGVITGTGKAFSAGHDLAEPPSAAGLRVEDLFNLMGRIYKPLIAAINGLCLAQGCGIALATDIQIASSEARFGWPQVKRGITSVNGPAMLARRAPLNKALEYLFTGDFLTAAEALALHLVNQVVPPDELMPAAEAMAGRILAAAPLAVRAMKEATLTTLSLRPDEAYAVTNLILERVMATADAQEGLAAFKEKRPPIWQAR